MAADIEQEEKTEIVEVFTTKNRGRGVRVTRDVKAGTLLLTEKPFEFVLQNNERGFYCDQCLTKRCGELGPMANAEIYTIHCC